MVSRIVSCGERVVLNHRQHKRVTEKELKLMLHQLDLSRETSSDTRTWVAYKTCSGYPTTRNLAACTRTCTYRCTV